jgi:hypothetical protein
MHYRLESVHYPSICAALEVGEDETELLKSLKKKDFLFYNNFGFTEL